MPKTQQNTEEDSSQKIDVTQTDSELTTRTEDILNSSSQELARLGKDSIHSSLKSKDTDSLKKTDNTNKIAIKKAQDKILLSIECTILNFLIENIILIICSIAFKFCLFSKQDGLPVISIIISLSSFTFNLILMISVKYGFTNDSNATKLFRALVITVFLLLLVNFAFQISICVNDYMNIKNINTIRKYLYSLSGFSIIFFIPTSIKGFILSCESFLILVNAKDEYKHLFIDEKERFIAYDKFYKANFGLSKKEYLLNNASKYMPEKEILEKINPLYYNFHNSVNTNRKDDEYYKKTN